MGFDLIVSIFAWCAPVSEHTGCAPLVSKSSHEVTGESTLLNTWASRSIDVASELRAQQRSLSYHIVGKVLEARSHGRQVSTDHPCTLR
eukprot:NODE_25367_length_589_cov_7.965368.p1 GENE.NODE_25367_length_589_cov_7.965368~~NODE_25367_length_589_cov_7.965368.p1  ORF type:complete len:89 (-),score=0.07 NODE_25367_length_589_cov_7.965368:4-270(-)